MTMLRRIRQWLCARKGHLYRTIMVPIVGERPGDPDVETTFCQGCGAIIEHAWTDCAGTERR